MKSVKKMGLKEFGLELRRVCAKYGRSDRTEVRKAVADMMIAWRDDPALSRFLLGGLEKRRDTMNNIRPDRSAEDAREHDKKGGDNG